MYGLTFTCFKTEVSPSPSKFLLTRLFICKCRFTPSWSVGNVESAMLNPTKLDTCIFYSQIMVSLCLNIFS